MTKDEILDVIHELSDIRAQYSYWNFNEEERKKYFSCSVAIAALRSLIYGEKELERIGGIENVER
jgi:hypothetical protein